MSSSKDEAVIATPVATNPEKGPDTTEDPKRTRFILRQLDLRVLPFTLILYGVSYADRAAIGNARAAGLMTDLKLSDSQYAFAVTIFFVIYAVFEVPANICLRIVGARIWLPLLAVTWGLCQLCTGFVQNYAGLCIVRTFLGVCESGILPGVMATMSILYPHSAIQARYGALFAFNALVAAFAGLLAYGLVHINSSFEGWRWLFVIEGLITIALAIPAYMTIRSTIEEATFLSEADQAYLKDRLEWDQGRRETVEVGATIRRRHIIAAFKDVKVWLGCISLFGSATPGYTIGLALPSLLRLKLHHTAIQSQLLTVPVYAFTALFVIGTSLVSDKYNQRALLLICSALLGTIGWSIGYSSERDSVQYFAFFLSAAASWSATPSAVALVSQNLAGRTKRTAGMAILISVGGIGSILASNIAHNKDAPRFAVAYKVNIAMCAMCALFAGAHMLWLQRENRIKANLRDTTTYTEEELDQMGDGSPFFVYRF